MHDTSLYSAQLFADTYGKDNLTVVDLGGVDNNNYLRNIFNKRNMKYICVDIQAHPSVDIIINPGDKLPFDTGSIDIMISTSCFEHDPCFWITFKEMCRVTKLDGFIYVNAPSNGPYHGYPGDNWRFYGDAGQALAYWSGISYGNENIYPVSVEETFFIHPRNDVWTDFVCIWKRVLEKETNITISKEIREKNGLLQTTLYDNNFDVRNTI
jgi:SAM-dependent methyltransferase